MFNFCSCFKPDQEPLSEWQRAPSVRRNDNGGFQKESFKHGDSEDRIINLDAGDPTMFETFWKSMGQKARLVMPGWKSMSYYSSNQYLCWFLEPELANEIVRLHNVVGNAVTDGRYIVVGTGSSQLILAALYALSSSEASQPINVVSRVPYYSSYPMMSDFMKSNLFKWSGAAETFEKDEAYVEMVTSPNNPDGSLRVPVVNRTGGKLIHDLAYYWPHYTPITSPADHDLTLFTVSKCTGHAGSRIGWALVKDVEVAKKMIKFIELSTIGASKDSQLRAAKILNVISESCEQVGSSEYIESFYDFGHRVMTERWQRLKQAVKHSGSFSLPEYPSAYCKFFRRTTENTPAFAWLKSEIDEEDDCALLLRRNKILARNGENFGCSKKFVRVSMVDRDDNFDVLVRRISNISLRSAD